MNDRDLAIFAAVARTGGIGRAALELNTVQSNVTGHIRLLEEELGHPLFLRHPRGVTLTPAGQRLLPYALRIGDLMRDAKRAACDDGVPRGSLRIGSMETTAALRLPDILMAFTRDVPLVDLSLVTGNTTELVAAVRERHLDGAFVAGAHEGPDFVSEPMFRERLVLVTAAGLRIEDLAKMPELRIAMFKRGCVYRHRLETVLAARGLAAARVLELGAFEAIIGCVAAGLGISLLPEGVVRDAADAGRIALHDLPSHEAETETHFLRRRDAFVSSAMAAFIDLAKATPGILALAAE